MTRNPHIGSDFSDFLNQEGIYEAVTAHAAKQVRAWQCAPAIGAQAIYMVGNGAAGEGLPGAVGAATASGK